MVRTCPHCKSFDGTVAKIVKMKEPVVLIKNIKEIMYEMKITHRCENCGCSFGDGKKKKVELDVR
jgi:hypothetical protein